MASAVTLVLVPRTPVLRSSFYLCTGTAVKSIDPTLFLIVSRSFIRLALCFLLSAIYIINYVLRKVRIPVPTDTYLYVWCFFIIFFNVVLFAAVKMYLARLMCCFVRQLLLL
ncbi:unnamed protein product [Ectocarpus sp. 12 AP-2014]